MAETGLVLRSIPQAAADQRGKLQPGPDIQASPTDSEIGLGFFFASKTQCHQQIAIVDLCRPSDAHPAQLLAAAMLKQQTYGPFQETSSPSKDALCMFSHG